MLIMIAFPQLVEFVGKIIGIKLPVNTVFVMVTFILLIAFININYFPPNYANTETRSNNSHYGRTITEIGKIQVDVKLCIYFNYRFFKRMKNIDKDIYF